MLLHVKVIPRAKEPAVIPGNPFIVRVKSPPEGGKANEEMLKLLSEHFSIPVSNIRILKGKKSRKKVIEIIGL